MAVFELESYLKMKRRLFNTRLPMLLESVGSGSEGLSEAISYSLLGEGKRLRPILLIAAHELFAPAGIYAMDVACAIEMLHTYSLFHDDLPSFDDDSLRRGQPTSHVKFGEWTAILAGDALNTMAFGILAGGPDDVPTEWKLEVLRIVAAAAGAAGMAGGQALDMACQGRECSEGEIKTMQRLKTGSLIAAAAETGAILGGAKSESRERLRQFGFLLGRAFQIRDDILDIEGSQEELGKASGKDAAAGKATLPALLGADTAGRHADKLVDEAVSVLRVFKWKAEPLVSIARYIVARQQ